MMTVLAGVTAVLAGVGVAEALVVSRLVAAFTHRRPAEPSVRPAVTVLKPLHGDEPLLEAALTTLCRQDFPEYQIVFGVRDASDPAVAVVRRLQSRFPHVDIALVTDPTLHGRNHKVSNLINMLPAARHDVLVIADADVHARPDYLDRLVAALEAPEVGLVTTLYAGLPATASPLGRTPRAALPARLGAAHITYGFLPSAVLSRSLGRQDCLGATMGLRRHDLERIGGLHALVDHLADDNVLGRRIAALGLHVALADTVTLTTVPEANLGALFRHELRWARTIRTLEPAGFAASVVQYPLAWALLTVLLAGGTLWSIGLFFIAWVLRAAAALIVDGALARTWPSPANGEKQDSNDVAALAFCCPVWLLPLRDILSVVVM
ncbi:MAG TPA: bacteriohopanetetrol glucosamine biosynthesis glycosyltransferase HpnI, partial [Rhodopila sp.]|nr:bacteriohopanetetrol glucosamine biosynthesis glycosyltransferase HpnI [Rhodopila sp.]